MQSRGGSVDAGLQRHLMVQEVALPACCSTSGDTACAATETQRHRRHSSTGVHMLECHCWPLAPEAAIQRVHEKPDYDAVKAFLEAGSDGEERNKQTR